MWNLFLDDIRNPPKDKKFCIFFKKSSVKYIICRSYNEAVEKMIELGCPTFISFDHDLGAGKTGYDLAKYIVNKDLDYAGRFIPSDFNYQVHSANPVGAKNIVGILTNYIDIKLKQ
jgi:hypothetical protein